MQANKKTNITLIGMPASGKSTIGVVLAKRLGKEFIDGDLLIQNRTGKLLKELISEYGDDIFRDIEDDTLASLETENSIIAPGGSVVYGEAAMENLKEISIVVYLEISYSIAKNRLGNLKERGVSIKKGQTLRDLYNERTRLYEKYADITVNEYKKTVSRIVNEICERIGEM